MIKLLGSQNTNDVQAQFRAEKFQLTLRERDSTAVITVGPEAPEISVGRWLQDMDEPGAGIVWIVRSVQTDYRTKMRTINCDHAISVLKDFLMFGEITPAVITGNAKATQCTADETFRYILGKQHVWQFGSVMYNDTQAYNFNGDDLFSAMETISATIPDAWWSYDFSVVPYRISVTEAPENNIGSLSELRMSRNIKSLSVTVDRNRMYTRFYPIGRNNLMLPEKFVSRNEAAYGIISRTETDENRTTEADLRKWANERLNNHAEPQVSISVSAMDLSEITGEYLDKFVLGAHCQIPLPEYGTTISERINCLTWNDKVRDRTGVQIQMANTKEDLAKVLNKTAQKTGSSRRTSAVSTSKTLKDVKLDGPKDNVYTLSKVLTNGKTEEIGTFSRAVTGWLVGAKDGKISVTALPQDTTKELWVRQGAMTRSGNKYTGTIDYKADDEENWGNTGAGIVVDASPIYNNGWTDARNSVRNKQYQVGEVVYDYFPASAVPLQRRLQYMQVAQPNATVGGGIDDTNRFRYYVTSGKNDAYIRYSGTNGYIVAAVTHGQYDAGWGAARAAMTDKTYTYGGKTYDYFPTTGVAADDRLSFLRTAKPSETVDGGINDRNTYQYVLDAGNDNVAYIRYGNSIGPIVAAVTHDKYKTGYNNGWGAARGSVSGKTYEVDGKTYDYFPASAVASGDRLQYMQVAKPSETVDGGIDDNNRYRYYITSGANDAYIRYGSANGYIVAAVNHGQYTSGYNTGWGAARGSVSGKTYEVGGKTYDYFPASAVAAGDRLQYMQVAKPSETVDGGIDDTNRYRYYITSGANDAYIRYGSANGYIVAAVNHGQYTSGYNTGWGAARGSVMGKTYTVDGKTYDYFPASAVAAGDRLEYMQVAVPSATVDGGIDDTNRYRYYITSGANDAYIRYGTSNGYIVAAINHNQYSTGYTTGYSTGWGAARNSVDGKTYTVSGKTYDYFPASAVAQADRLDYIQVAKPSATVDGGIDDNNRYKYVLTTENGYAYLRYATSNGYIVAQKAYPVADASNIQLYANGVGEITRSITQPTGQSLSSLATILKQAYLNQGGAGQYVRFPATITGGTGTKWYFINMG